MKNYKSEILIYLNQVKIYFKNNIEAFDYFQIDVNPDLFYSKLCEISEVNFEKNGDPQLTMTQFEYLKKEMISLRPIPATFEAIPNFGSYSLN